MAEVEHIEEEMMEHNFHDDECACPICIDERDVEEYMAYRYGLTADSYMDEEELERYLEADDDATVIEQDQYSEYCLADEIKKCMAN